MSKRNYVWRRREEGATFQKIADELGISRQWAHQLYNKKPVVRYKGKFNSCGVSHLRIHHVSQGLTLAKLAKEAGVSPATISRLNRGGEVTELVATRVALAVDIPLLDLFEPVYFQRGVKDGAV